MSRLSFSSVAAFTLIIIILGTGLYSNVTKPRIMILQSYSPDYPWTRDIDAGLRRVTDQWSNYAVTWYYMDTKRHADPHWLRRAGIGARRSIDQLEPRVLIAIDDPAQALAAKYYVNKPGMDIVFAGVNGSVAPYGYEGAENVTGIFERKQLRAVRETVLALEAAKARPKSEPSLLYILDPSESLRSDRPYVDGFPWTPVRYAGSIMARDFTHWKRLFKERAASVDYVLVANYRKLPLSESDPTFADPVEVMTWTETHSPTPVVGVNVFNVSDGAMLSVGVSPYEQGEVAARLAQEVLTRGVRGAAIPRRMNKLYIIAMRESALKRRGIRLPTIYEAFGRATANYME